jgi:hypothetical protein
VSALDGWENFYVIVGSSAGALIGLQFVVMTLIADLPASRVDPQAGAAFATPSVIHFGVVLFLSAILSAPWHGIGVVSVLWGWVGLGGVLYGVIVFRRMRAQAVYKPVLEDWIFHFVLPFVAYILLTLSALVAHVHAPPALFMVAGTSLLLLFTGIHNAWDTIMYQVFVLKHEQRKLEQPQEEPPEGPVSSR